MKIELKNIKVAHSLSEETNAYTATVYVDGVRAFHASNHGQGGCDSYHRVEGYTGPGETAIDAWCKANLPATVHGDMTIEASMEGVIGDLVEAHIKEAENRKIRAKFDRLLRDHITAIRAGKIVSWAKTLKVTPANIDRVKAGNPNLTIVNGADNTLYERALRIYCPNLDD